MLSEKNISSLTFQIKQLEWHIDEAFPDMELSQLDLKRLKNFIRMFLALKPSERPPAELAMKHRFLSSGLFMPKPDAVWRKKGEINKPLFCFITFVNIVHLILIRVVRFPDLLGTLQFAVALKPVARYHCTDCIKLRLFMCHK